MATLDRSFGAPTSQYKIQCKGSTVLIGSDEYLSATEALEAYISQYERQGVLSNRPGLYKRTVNDLLNPKNALHLTAERSLDSGVRDTERELKLADTKESINESLLKMKKNVSLKAEEKKNYYRKQKQRVDEALNKSQELLKQLNSNDYPKSTECPSDVGSLNTEVLLSIDPANPDSVAAPNWKSKHVYGYKRPRARRSKTLSSIQISHDMMGLMTDQPIQSYTAQPTDKTVKFDEENVLATSPEKKTSYDDDVSLLLGESPDNTRLSRSPNKKAHERSRSVSPSILKRERKLFESGLRDKPIPDFYTEVNTSKTKAPSWIDTMNLSDVSDSDWKKRDFTTSRPPPSWVKDMDMSDITSVVSPPKPAKTLQYHDLLRPLPIINTQQDNSLNNSDTIQDTLPGPGLTYRDLLGNSSKLKVQTGNTHTQNASPLSPTLSDKLKDLKIKTTNALERYHDRAQTEFDTPSKGSNPKCSSFDLVAMTKGIQPPGSTSITGASPIIAGNHDTMLKIGESPGKISRPKTPDTDVILDGDRPWENTASYKPPVSMGNTSKRSSDDEKTFSGGPQHGSLEQLKNMIFKLQQEAVHTDSEDEGSRQKLSERVYKLRAEAANLGIPVPQTEEPVTADVPALKDYDYKGEPGGQSLEKAMVHLDRLKTLVSNSQQKKDGDAGQSGRVTPLCAHMEQ